MANFKKKKHTFLHSIPVLVFLGVLIVFFSYKLFGVYGKTREAVENKKAVLHQIETMKMQETELREDIVELKTPEGIEKTIREKFRVVKEGEGVIVLVDEDPEPEKEKKNIFQKVKGLFGEE